MFTWLGTQFATILSTYVLGVVSSLMTALTPIALSAMTVWVFLYGWAVLRNEVPETVPVFLWKITKLGLVLAFALSAGVYVPHVAETANALATGVATTFLPSSAPAGLVASPWTLLDRFNDAASEQVADIMRDAGITRLDLFFAAGVFSIGTVAFLCVAVFIVTLSTVFMTFVIGVGPLFILCLAWRPTQRFFDSWLSMLLNAVVLTWFAFFALGLSTYIGAQMFDAIRSGGGFLGAALNVLAESTRYCVLMLVMAIICFQAPSLASALTGGPAVQQGIQMVQNVLMIAGLSRVATTPTTSAPVSGGVIRAGGRWATAMRAAGNAYERTRLAAYRLAALRGRSST